MGVRKGDEENDEGISPGQRHIRILRSSPKEANVEEFIRWVKEWFGVEIEVPLFKSGKRRIRASSYEAHEFGSESVIKGVYVAKWAPYGYILSIEGSYLVGKKARRHVVQLNREQFLRWMSGENLRMGLQEKGVYIVKYGKIFAGSGYFDGNELINLIPKSRTLETNTN
ncbi:MAG: hypothetical protein DRN78_04290 [Thermoproteota archaeon]|nr:MAG: hypothetical protein DRN78_04290 [Candidatus Korarchaeota archaeon]